MERRYSLAEANRMMPLIGAITAEFAERRDEQQRLLRLMADLRAAATPEGVDEAVAELGARVAVLAEGMRKIEAEFEGLGLSILRTHPLTLHIPGATRHGPIVFCWQEGEPSIAHGHAVGEEEDPRRPLRVRSDSNAA